MNCFPCDKFKKGNTSDNVSTLIWLFNKLYLFWAEIHQSSTETYPIINITGREKFEIRTRGILAQAVNVYVDDFVVGIVVNAEVAGVVTLLFAAGVAALLVAVATLLFAVAAVRRLLLLSS